MVDALMDIPWAVMLIVLPLAAGIIAFIWPRIAQTLVLCCNLAIILAVTGLAFQLWQHGVYHHVLGGWNAPLGIGLYADGLSLMLLTVTSVVGTGISVYASTYFSKDDAHHFWPIWLFLLAALNALFLSADLFNLYITLELMGLAAVALSALSGGREALAGAVRYLFVSLSGSLAYLLGVVLLYHAFGSIDIATLAGRITSEPTVWVAFALMSVGLLLKTALFPLHFWLPSVHTGAPSPVSAVLSALVIKASLYIFFRLWIMLFGPFAGDGIATLLGGMGVAAIIWGSVQALRQTRVKLLVAYSTVAQVGYLFLAFPLATTTAWGGATILILSHALAKSAMFLTVGNLLHFGGHDRIVDLDRVVQRLPLSAFAFALAGISLMGLPPSGGFIGKWLLLESALAQGHWVITVVILLGGLLTAAYIFKVLGRSFTQAEVTHQPRAVPARMEWVALMLACGAILMGFVATPVLSLLEIGTPFTGSQS